MVAPEGTAAEAGRGREGVQEAGRRRKRKREAVGIDDVHVQRRRIDVSDAEAHNHDSSHARHP